MNGDIEEEDYPDSEPPPLFEQESIQGLSLNPRDFVVYSEDKEVDLEYRVGRFALPSSGLVLGVISVAVLDGRLLVGLPEVAWSRSASQRLLAAKSLSKPILCSVASCSLDSRTVLDPSKPECKVWFGFIDPKLEAELDFIGEEPIAYGFSPTVVPQLLPFGAALVEVSQTHYTFATAESTGPGLVPPVCTPAQENAEVRISALEASLVKIQHSLERLAGTAMPAMALQQPEVGEDAVPRAALLPTRPKAAPRASALRSRKEPPVEDPMTLYPGLDRDAAQAALAAGVPAAHLAEMSAILQGRPRRLDEIPRKTPPKSSVVTALDESEDEEELLEEGAIAASGSLEAGHATGKIEQALMKLTVIADKLTGAKDKAHKIDHLLDGGAGPVGASEAASSSGGNRKSAAAMRALQKALVEDPKYLYQRMEANVQADFLSRPVAPGEPMSSGCTIRGWLAARSRVQLYHNHVRWCWQTAGIWDCLISGRVDEARARCGLLLAAAEQASIDGGSWVMSGVAMMEQPPPFQAFATHQPPSNLELQHSVIYDARWADTFLNHLKDVDSFVDAKKKLSSGNRGRDAAESGSHATGIQAKPKAKAKAKDKPSPKKPQDAGAPDGAQQNA